MLNFKEIQKQLSNIKPEWYLIACLIVYICWISMFVPQSIINIVSQPLVRLALIGAIIYSSQYDMKVSILLSIALVITINLKTLLHMVELKNVQTEHFEDLLHGSDEGNVSDTDSESDSDSEEGNESDTDSDGDSEEDSDTEEEIKDGSKNTGIENTSDSESDSESESDSDSDEETETETFTSSPDVQDDFTKLHKALHQFDTFLSEK